MRKLLKTGAALLFAGVALLGAGSLDARAEVVEEHVDVGNPRDYYRLCHTNGWYYVEYEGVYGAMYGFPDKDGITVFGYDGPDEHVTVPEMLDGFYVVAVSDEEPGGMCDNKKEMSRKVKSLEISENIENINSVWVDFDPEKCPDYYRCLPMNELENLEQYFVSGDNNAYKSENGVLFSKDGKYLVHYPPNRRGRTYHVPDGVEVVCMDAFYKAKNLTTVVFPDSVKVIGFCAFGYNENLKKVFVPASVKSVETGFGNAVAYCQKGSYAEQAIKRYDGQKIKSYGKPSQTGKITVKAPKNGNKVSLSWKSVSGASGYEVYKSGSRYDGWEKEKEVPAKGKKGRQSCTVLLKDEIAAWYQVRAYKKAGPGKIYGSCSEPVFVLARPGTVKDAGASRISSKACLIEWERLAYKYQERCSGYQIYRRDLPSQKYKKVATVKSGYDNFYTDKGLKKGKKYYYKVRAYNSAEGKKTYGPFSKPIKVSGK